MRYGFDQPVRFCRECAREGFGAFAATKGLLCASHARKEDRRFPKDERWGPGRRPKDGVSWAGAEETGRKSLPPHGLAEDRPGGY